MVTPFFDPVYILFALPAIVVGLVATLLLRYWSGKYMQTQNVNHINGIDTLEKISQANGYNLRLEVVEQSLGDHFNPATNTVGLSREVAYTTSIGAVAIAAHELGHVDQYHSGSLAIRFRNTLVPLLNFGTGIGYYLLIFGIIIGFAELAWLGIILFSGATFFSLLTLPIEIDASNRAIKLIKNNQLLYPDEIPAARKVLFAAALTYVAATLQSLGSLIYFFLRVRGIGRRD